MRKKIIRLLNESAETKRLLARNHAGEIEKLARMMISVIKGGRKILIFGNGGSAADSIHITAELVGRFRRERRPYPAIALPANISSLTALSNDYCFEAVFERQIEALGKKGDLALGISTSGRSKNVIRAIEKASKMKMKTAVLVGNKKTPLAARADIAIMVPSGNTPRVQESHITIAHILCEIIEDALR